MPLKANYEFLFFGKDDNSFLENYSYDLFQDHGERSGQIFINLEIQNNPVDAEEIGAVIFETMQKVFFEEVAREPYERFELAVKAVNGILHEFKSQKVSGYIGNLNVIIAAIVGDTLLLTQSGDAEAYLLRSRYVSIVSEGLSEDESEDVFSSIANGQIEAGDLILFSSTRLLRYISKTDLAKSVNKKSIVETLNEIKDVISTEVLGRIGMTGILFSNMSAMEIEDIESEVDNATINVLEGTAGHVAHEKESVTGRFVTAFKNYTKKKKAQVYEGPGRDLANGRVGKMVKGLGEKGFGKNKILGMMVVLVVMLVVGIIYANNRGEIKEKLAELDKTLTNVQTMIAQAETRGTYDKEGAKQILDEAYQDTVGVLNSGYYRDKANVYLNQIDEVRDSLDNVQRVDDPELVADLSQKRADVDALGLVAVSDRLFAFEYNGLYEIVLDQVQDPLTIDDEETVIAATGFDERGSIVFLTKSGKLIEYREGTMSFMDTDDGTFRKAVDIEDWSNKIYLLDPTESQIWRYNFLGTQDKFSSAEGYLSGDDDDLSSGVGISIDANVYTLSSNGDIQKFYAGAAAADFSINNEPFNAYKSPKAIYTNETLDEVYVLDAEASRVLVFTKDAKTGSLNYKAQYLIEGVGELRDVYVEPDSGELYVLTKNKIYKVSL